MSTKTVPLLWKQFQGLILLQKKFCQLSLFQASRWKGIFIQEIESENQKTNVFTKVLQGELFGPRLAAAVPYT